MEERIDSLLKQMTLDEKLALVAGADMWSTLGVERLGIPPFKLSDGPAGVRGAGLDDGLTSASFPCGTALAATWNPELVRRVGRALGQEARSKGASVLLGPTVNLHRHPLGGRNFEGYSEDPFLSARLTVAYVEGVQSEGVAACVKHFVCNESEFERHTISSDVDERALRELYLPPFEAAVREADAWSVMSSYNKLGGTWASENPGLLQGILKDEWGFQGFVVSDWFGTNDGVACANAGLDLEMPGPARHFRADKLKEALAQGQVDESRIDDKVRRLLRVAARTGALEAGGPAPERADDRPEHRALAREAAAESFVLLKNERDLLPLDRDALGTLAVIGPGAGVARIQGGGSVRVRPHYGVRPLDGIRERCGDGVEVLFERGCTIHRSLPALTARQLEGDAFRCELFPGLEPGGEPTLVRQPRELQLRWFGAPGAGLDPKAFSARITGRLVPEETGTYTFGLTSAGLSRLSLDGQLRIDNWSEQTRGDSFFGLGSSEVTAEVELEAGRAVELCVEYSKRGAPGLGGVEVSCLPPVPDDLMERAVAAAEAADAVVLVIGLDGEWETEGRDREDMSLPGRQVELVERVAAVNPNTLVVLNAGAPVETGWIDRVPAALQVWYPGQELGRALADVIFGDVSPSGRLPHTLPVRLEDTPAFTCYPGENGHVRYAEGVFAGYRWYDARRIAPRFPFGHGLSYTRFEYGELEVAADEIRAGQELRARLEVRNVGERTGAEVVQLYVGDCEARLARPKQELKGFVKLTLAPGESRRVEFPLDARTWSYWDPSAADGTGAWVAEPGDFVLRAGPSSRDLRARARVRLLPD